MASTEAATTGPAISVLFVCLGNICRSPMAEAVFRHKTLSNPRIQHIDSAGTEGYNVGNGPDERTMSVLRDNGIIDYAHVARKVRRADFLRFDYIVAMDKSNLRDLQVLRQRVAGQGSMDHLGRVVLFGDYGDVTGEEIIDPWYGELLGFEVAYEQLLKFSDGFLKNVLGAGQES